MAAVKKNRDKEDEDEDERETKRIRGKAKQYSARYEVEPDGGNTGKGKPTNNEGRRSRNAKTGETTLRGSTKTNSQMHRRTPEGQTSGKMRKCGRRTVAVGITKPRPRRNKEHEGKGRGQRMKGGKRWQAKAKP